MKARFTCVLLGCLTFVCACSTLNHVPFSAAKQRSQADATLALMEKVANWQLANPSSHHVLDWTHGALYPGYLALDGLCANTKYREAVKAVGEQQAWKNWTRLYHADDYAVSQAFSELYMLYREPKMVAPSIEQFDFILDHPATCDVGEIKHGKRGKDDAAKLSMRWWWCDALFMAPPAWAKIYDVTDDAKYLDFMIREWKATSAFLYDEDEHLFFRDKSYFPDRKKEANGRKVFWGRGNGWVLGGLVRVLQILPAHHPERRFFVRQFQEMCRKMIAIQPDDGVWRASLLDPASYPLQETSSTSFICYALAWGINQGYLSEAEALPALRKAYAALSTFVEPDGKLTHVQPIGADPQKFDVSKTEIYGVGAFLMASSEIYRLDLLKALPHASVTVENKSSVFCRERTIEMPWSDVVKKIPTATVDNLAVMDGVRARWIVSQIMVEAGKPVRVLFQTDLHPGQCKTFLLVAGLDRSALPQSARTTFARFVPERKDDFAWENDRVAFRAYGPALWVVDGEKPGRPALIGNGVDAFGKSCRQPIINRIFKEKNYHAPNLGYGIDCYKVGTGPGCGGSAVVDKGVYVSAITFESWKLLDNGPIRSRFELSYKTGETRCFEIDLGSNFYKVTSRFPQRVTPACGATYRPVSTKDVAMGEGWIADWEPAQDDLKDNYMGIAVVVPKGGLPVVVKQAAWIHVPACQEMVAYAGSCWSGGMDYPHAEVWFRGVEDFRRQCAAEIYVH